MFLGSLTCGINRQHRLYTTKTNKKNVQCSHNVFVNACNVKCFYNRNYTRAWSWRLPTVDEWGLRWYFLMHWDSSETRVSRNWEIWRSQTTQSVQPTYSGWSRCPQFGDSRPSNSWDTRLTRYEWYLFDTHTHTQVHTHFCAHFWPHIHTHARTNAHTNRCNFLVQESPPIYS